MVDDLKTTVHGFPVAADGFVHVTDMVIGKNGEIIHPGRTVQPPDPVREQLDRIERKLNLLLERIDAT